MWGQSPKLKGPRAEVGFLGQPAPSPPARGSRGSTISSPSGVRGGVPAAKMFSCILQRATWPLPELVGSKFGGHGSIGPFKFAHDFWGGVAMWFSSKFFNIGRVRFHRIAKDQSIGQLIGSPAFSAALALPVVSRRMRTRSCGVGVPRCDIGLI